MKSIQLHCLITFFCLLLPAHSYSMTPGTLDPSFGGGTLGPIPGTVVTELGGGDDVIFALVHQPDRKVVAAGSGANNFALVRYLPNGNLDESFGNEGKVITSFFVTASANSLILQPDGKLVAAGTTNTGTVSNFALARYLPNGDLDESFGNGGKVTNNFSGDDRITSLILQPDGKLVVAGKIGSGAAANFALARYLLNGDLDPIFGNNGIVTTDFGSGADIAHALALQPDGKLVAAGQATIGGDSNFALARYNSDGSPDVSFGGLSFGPIPGTVVTDFGSGEDIARALVLQPDGKLVVAGRATIGGDSNFALARYNSDGSPDVSFGGPPLGPLHGTIVTDFGTLGAADGDDAYALILQPNGKLVAAGSAFDNIAFGLARYNLDGSLDITFNPTGGGNAPGSPNPPGTVITSIEEDLDIAVALILQTDGAFLKLLAGGTSAIGTNNNFSLAQYFAVNDISPLASNVIAKYCSN